jgi:methylmalonyl-CoA mutase N-terminal domain/subunit
MQVEDQERIVVGVNKFKVEETDKKQLLKVDPHVEILQRKKIEKLKKDRDGSLVENSLELLKEKAKTDENLMPYILDSVKAYATLGEICGVLREVFGEYEQSVIL